MRNQRRLLFGLAVVLAGLGSARTAEGSFPGPNGRLAVSLGYFPQNCGSGSVTLNPAGLQRLRCVTPRGFADVSSPEWSPDGRRLVAESPRGIVLMDADGSHARVIAAAGPGEGTHEPSFAPDGRHFVYQRGGSIWRATIGRRTERLLASGSSPRWSPDGGTIAYSRSTGIDSDRVFIMSARTGRRIRRLREGTRPLDWSPDGRRLLLAAAGAEAGVWILRADGKGGEQGIVIRRGSNRVEDAAWSPDGRRIAVTGVEYDDEQARHSVWTMSPRGAAQKPVFRSDRVEVEETGSTLLSWGVRPG